MGEREPRAAEGDPLGEALAGAARRAGFGRVADGQPVTGRTVLDAVGGVRGIVEALVPGVLFVGLFAFTRSLPLALAVSVGMSVLLVVARMLQHSPVSPALGGLVATVASAVLALVTGRAEDNFLLGIATNAAYGGGLLISVLAGWPLIGLAVGFLYGEGTAWRQDRRKFRAMQWLTLMWVALFLLRLAVQVPLYSAGQIELLGTFKLIMGLPLFAPLLVVSWLVVRAAFPQRSAERHTTGD